jgi:hypothetical protein
VKNEVVEVVINDMTVQKFDEMMWSLGAIDEVIEVRVHPWLYKKLELKAGHFNSKGYPAYKSRLVFATDFGDIPIVGDENVKLWKVVRGKKKDESQPLMMVRSLMKNDPDARIQQEHYSTVEDATDGDRHIVLFALEEGMVPVIHQYVTKVQAQAILEEFEEHHTITLQNYHHLSEAIFRPVWVSISYEFQSLRKVDHVRIVDTKKGEDDEQR